MTNKTDYVELGLACAEVCKALNRGMNGKNLDDLSQPVQEAIAQLAMWVNPVRHALDSSLTTFLITELWGRSGRRSPRRVVRVYPPDLSMRRTIRIRLPLGS